VQQDRKEEEITKGEIFEEEHLGDRDSWKILFLDDPQRAEKQKDL
jgi:hypothetical protein